MRMTKYTLLVLLALLPLLAVQYFTWEWERMAVRLEESYKERLEDAMADGVAAIKAYSHEEFRGEQTKRVALNTEAVLGSFRQSLYFRFQVLDPAGRRNLEKLFPAVVLLGYDGFYCQGWQAVEMEGEEAFEKVLGVKRPYAVPLGGDRVLYLRLDRQVAYGDLGAGRLLEMEYGELHALLEGEDALPDALPPPEGFEDFRRLAITAQVNRAMTEAGRRRDLAAHGRERAQGSVAFPPVDGHRFGASLDDLSLAVWMEGPPLGPDRKLNLFSVGKASLLGKKAQFPVSY
ncbi:hypothetical protein [Anaerotalea alkaliphila]|uniref:Uncharacterized protein n=1 Tax=Anaerotalea alkaliphila TaxID=2662126 RepID=A0A7X5HTJ9_9FIRM|nr:hypothetical protein [Anaerotalea alkaliphila]NDL66384.1 hypothetical protein [Anaerotalea alkaliphila]